jgi:hypothetical protein
MPYYALLNDTFGKVFDQKTKPFLVPMFFYRRELWRATTNQTGDFHSQRMLKKPSRKFSYLWDFKTEIDVPIFNRKRSL